MPVVRKMAKDIDRDHELAVALWESGFHEARILAGLVAEPDRMTKSLVEKWVKQLDSWDVCDQLCMNLLRKTPFANQKALAWSNRRAEFVKRAGFSMMAVLAVHDKAAKDGQFAPFLEAIVRESTDERNFVKKAVNWALRQIGKRNPRLNRKALAAAKRIAGLDSKASRWIARDAIRELTDEKVRERLTSRAR
jgi:3-methyladenine DNA glycosylase AlkD